MAVAAMHRIRARAERLALPASVRRVARRLAVDDVRSDGQHALRMRRVPIGRVLADLLHEAGHDGRGDLIDTIVVVAELRRRLVALVLKVDHESILIAGNADLAIFDRAETVGNYRQPGDSERHRA